MNILMITATYLPSANGVAVSISSFKKTLEDRGHKVLVIAPEEIDKKSYMEGVVRFPSVQNPVVKDYPLPLYPGTRKVNKIIKNFEPDIVHVHHPAQIGYFGEVVAKKYEIPLVFTFHSLYDLYLEKYVYYLPKKLRNIFLENTVYKLCQNADLVVSPSEFLEKDLLNKYPYLNVVTSPSPVIENIVVNDVGGRDSVRKDLGLKRNQKLLFCVSRLGREKNLEVLIGSMKHLKGFVLVVAGGGPDEDKLRKLVNNSGLDKRVILLGKVPHEEIHKYYKAADLFYYSSQTETQGIIFLEALTFGLPIVSVESPASKEWVKDGFGVLTENSEKSLAGSVKKILQKDIVQLRKNALDYSKNFSETKIAVKVENAYLDIIKRKNLARKLLKTGWQSWSPNKKSLIPYPEWNYKPNKDFYLPTLDVPKLKKPIKGWCSWYCFGKQIDEQKILNQTEWFSQNKNVPIDYILVDEGWTERGDWGEYDSIKFPNGLESLSKNIKEYGFKPGVWIAPFLVSPESKKFEKESRDLVTLSKVKITGVRSFPIFDLLFPNYILDVRKEKVFKSVLGNIDLLLGKYKFDLIKMDFLYSIFFIPGISEKEAGYIVNNLFKYIRDKYPNVYTIASAAPLTSVLGVADSVRIGPDATFPFYADMPFLRRIYNTISLRKVVRSLALRDWTRKYWNIDPDVFICREGLGVHKGLLLSLRNKVQSSNGNIFLGDDLTKLPTERIKEYIEPLFRK